MGYVKVSYINEAFLKLKEKALSLPRQPGCYLMENQSGQVIYVGKAKDLKQRVASYFGKSKKNPKTEILISHITGFEFILTQTDAEAFVLENNLIKKYSPKYNIMMRDDKSYPYVVISKSGPFPRLEYSRRVKRNNKNEIYGPFVHGSNISEVLRILTKSFLLRDCTLKEMKSRYNKEPCLLYQIKQCSAPCVGKISSNEYENYLGHARSFFSGKGVDSVLLLEKKMLEVSEKQEFEQAAIIRDYINVLNEFLNFSKQESAELDGKTKNLDVVAYYIGEIEVEISIYIVRNRILLGHKSFHFPVIDCENEVEEELTNFLFQYYANSFDILPDKIIMDLNTSNFTLFSSVLESELKIKLIRPQQKFKSIEKLTYDHAKESQRVRITNQDSVYIGLNKLKELLHLKERPVILECYDIAVFQGKSPTAAQIVFENGVAVKKKYRHYNLTELPEGNNDFAMMKEVVGRRIKYGNLPDVFIIDGGKGQVSVVQAVLEEFDLIIPVVGIAKSKNIFKAKNKYSFASSEIKKSQERLVIPNRFNDYHLSKNRSLFKIIIQMRDEAHRFSRRLHHKKEKARTFSSWLDEVEGVGPKTREKIVKRLDKNLSEISRMTVDEVMGHFKVTKKIAENIVKSVNNVD